ncbi:SPOR domain-containing protein [Caldimonas tepidiphila]|uniref:SPOR domain-containing protein n=1 Tax=Caldimonas tepidiphila TaxID=2315841 RepID=UPI000E5A882F|nr:SPOR domain-containing protein [Caldimonas tepidiphila]
MGLLSFLKRTPAAGAATSPAAASAAFRDEPLERARTRAKHRLIGAVVLLGVAVIGFPLLFETQPRPIPVDLPIHIPKKDAVPPLALPGRDGAVAAAGPAAPALIHESAGEATREVDVPEPITPPLPRERREAGAAEPPPAAASAAKPPPKPQPKPESRPELRAETRPEPKPVPKPEPAPRIEPKPAPKPEPRPAAREEPRPEARPPARATEAEAGRAQALLEGRAPAARTEPVRVAETGRFVLQVGAYSEGGSARDARQKVERVGLRSYTQEVETSDGRRIRVRVGPFTSREEADQAAARLRAAGLPVALLPQ